MQVIWRRRGLFSAVPVVVAALSFTSCSSSGLSRAKAKEVLSQQPFFTTQHVKDQLRRGVTRQTLLERGGFHNPHFRKAIAEIYWDGNYEVDLKHPYHERIDEITGIADLPFQGNSHSIKEVDFTWSETVPKIVKRFAAAWRGTGKAVLRRYDDGSWRVMDRIETEAEDNPPLSSQQEGAIAADIRREQKRQVTEQQRAAALVAKSEKPSRVIATFQTTTFDSHKPLPLKITDAGFSGTIINKDGDPEQASSEPFRCIGSMQPLSPQTSTPPDPRKPNPSAYLVDMGTIDAQGCKVFDEDIDIVLVARNKQERDRMFAILSQAYEAWKAKYQQPLNAAYAALKVPAH